MLLGYPTEHAAQFEKVIGDFIILFIIEPIVHVIMGK
jgi:hypothetical protein